MAARDFTDHELPFLTDEVLRAKLERLHRATSALMALYPRLSTEHATAEQQRALRVLLVALEECGLP